MEHILIQKMGKQVSEVKKNDVINPIVMIVEGVDLAGKGYLVHAISKKYPSIVIKYTKRPLSKKKIETTEFKKLLYKLLDFVNHNRKEDTIIFDRFFPSELVYSKVKRGYDAFEDKNYPQMERVIKALPHIYIYCNPGYDTLVQRLKDRGDEHIFESDIKELVNRYDRFFRQTKMYKLELDTTKTKEEMLDIIKQKLEYYNEP